MNKLKWVLISIVVITLGGMGWWWLYSTHQSMDQLLTSCLYAGLLSMMLGALVAIGSSRPTPGGDQSHEDQPLHLFGIGEGEPYQNRYEPYEEKAKRIDEAFLVAMTLFLSGLIVVGATFTLLEILRGE